MVKHLRSMIVGLLCTLLAAKPIPTQATRPQTAYDCAVATGLPKTECEALVTLYTATGGDNWVDRQGWLQTTTPCTWSGVTCTGERVTGLSLPSNHLNGALPSEIGGLTALKHLYLWDNAVTALPPEIGNLTALESLFLDYNDIAVLPSEVGTLTSLQSLSLSGNALTALPPEIANLTGLQDLHLGNNALAALPVEIGNLTTLHALYMGHNALTALPAEIGNLAALKELCVNHNKLTTLPPEIGNLTALRYLALGDNKLTVLPPEIENITALNVLYLNDNVFSGAIPDMLTVLASLQYFTFYNTAWCVPETGPVPAWLASIAEVYGTGKVCEQAPGSLRGVVTLPDAAPAAGVRVNLYRPIEWDEWGYVTTTHTLTDGTYQLDGLGQEINYRVQFVDPAHIYAPEYYDNQPTLEGSTPVTVTLGMTRTGIDAVLSPAVVKSATPAITVCNNSLLSYQLTMMTDVEATLHLYDPLDSHLTWQGFSGATPETLTYAGHAVTGTVSLSATTPFTVAFTVRVNLPAESFVGEYAQVSNTAYYALHDETLLLAHPSNTQIHVVQACTSLYLPLVVRNF